MPVEGRYSVEEQRELVYEYLTLPYGAKGRFLVERGLPDRAFRRWKLQLFADTLDHGLVPRGPDLVSVEEATFLKHLIEQNRVLKEELDAREAEYQRQLAAKDADIAIQRRAVDALGKAIELLHPSGESKSSSGSAATEQDQPDA